MQPQAYEEYQRSQSGEYKGWPGSSQGTSHEVGGNDKGFRTGELDTSMPTTELDGYQVK